MKSEPKQNCWLVRNPSNEASRERSTYSNPFESLALVTWHIAVKVRRAVFKGQARGAELG